MMFPTLVVQLQLNFKLFELNSFLLEDESEILLLVILDNYFMIVGGWLEKALM